MCILKTYGCIEISTYVYRPTSMPFRTIIIRIGVKIKLFIIISFQIKVMIKVKYEIIL